MFTKLINAQNAVQNGVGYDVARRAYKIDTNDKADKIFKLWAFRNNHL